MKTVPYKFEKYSKPRGTILIACGSSDFTTDDGKTWVHKDTAQPFTFRATTWINGKPSLCPPGLYSWHLPLSPRSGGFNLIVLCGILDAGPEPGKSPLGPEDRGTFKQLYQMPEGSKGKLQAKSSLWAHDDDLQWVISRALMHELFHYVFGSNSQ
jgi:hypothetical protein